MAYLVVSPAYGRDYKSGKEARKAWDEGKDFVHETRGIFGGGTYVNKQDVDPDDSVEIRFNKLTNSTMIEGRGA